MASVDGIPYKVSVFADLLLAYPFLLTVWEVCVTPIIVNKVVDSIKNDSIKKCPKCGERTPYKIRSGWFSSNDGYLLCVDHCTNCDGSSPKWVI